MEDEGIIYISQGLHYNNIKKNIKIIDVSNNYILNKGAI